MAPLGKQKDVHSNPIVGNYRFEHVAHKHVNTRFSDVATKAYGSQKMWIQEKETTTNLIVGTMALR